MSSAQLLDTPSMTEARPPQRQWKRLFTMENRYLPPILITCILLSGQFTFGMLESWTRTASAIVT
jgi:hypothetical protein